MKSEMWERNEIRETMQWRTSVTTKTFDLSSAYSKEDVTRSIKYPMPWERLVAIVVN